MITAAVAIGIGVGVATPAGFARVADTAPDGRIGQTMGAAEIGRELGDAGGPLLVGALSITSLAVGLAALSITLAGIGLSVAAIQHTLTRRSPGPGQRN